MSLYRTIRVEMMLLRVLDPGPQSPIRSPSMHVTFKCPSTNPISFVSNWDFQNDHSYFFAEIFSNDGKIIYSSITDIWVTDESEPNLFSVPLYQDNAPLDLSWFNPNLGVDEAVPAVILDVQDSNYFAPLYTEQGTGDTDYGNFAGFHVLLDERNNKLFFLDYG